MRTRDNEYKLLPTIEELTIELFGAIERAGFSPEDPRYRTDRSETPIETIDRVLPENNYVSRRANVNATNDQGDTPLCYSITLENEDIALLLIERGADVNQLAADGTYPLLLAATAGKINIVRALVRAGADVNRIAPENNMTSLMAAADNNLGEIVQFLIEHGAFTHPLSRSGSSALNYAISNCGESVIFALLSSPDINLQTISRENWQAFNLEIHRRDLLNNTLVRWVRETTYPTDIENGNDHLFFEQYERICTSIQYGMEETRNIPEEIGTQLLTTMRTTLDQRINNNDAIRILSQALPDISDGPCARINSFLTQRERQNQLSLVCGGSRTIVEEDKKEALPHVQRAVALRRNAPSRAIRATTPPPPIIERRPQPEDIREEEAPTIRWATAVPPTHVERRSGARIHPLPLQGSAGQDRPPTGQGSFCCPFM